MPTEKFIQPLADEYLDTRSDESFKKLYNRILPGIKHFVWELSRNYIDDTTKEDIVAKTFFKAIININQYDPKRGNFSTWIFAIARNEVFNELRTYKRKIFMESLMADTQEKNEMDIACLDNVVDKEKYEVKFKDILQEEELYQKRRNLITLICWEMDHNLTPLYRDIIIDREINQMSYKEISFKYILPINTVKSRIKIGRELIRNSINEKAKPLKKEIQEVLYG